MESEPTLNIDSSAVSTPVVVTMVCLYILFRNMTSVTPTINFIKGKLRSLTGLFLTLSIISLTVYNITLYFLSTKFDIDKTRLELYQKFNNHYEIKIQEYTLDLGFILIASLKIADILFMSCIFLSISVITPSSKNSAAPSVHKTVLTISRLWSILRIPMVFYSDKLSNIINEKLAIFIMLMVFNIELVIASIFALISKFKNIDVKKPNNDSGFLSLCLFLYGFVKYSINFIDFPFKIDANLLSLIYSFQYALSISLYLLITGIIFPREKIAIIIKEKPENNPNTTSLAILEEIIEFDDLKKKLPN